MNESVGKKPLRNQATGKLLIQSREKILSEILISPMTPQYPPLILIASESKMQEVDLTEYFKRYK